MSNNSANRSFISPVTLDTEHLDEMGDPTTNQESMSPSDYYHPDLIDSFISRHMDDILDLYYEFQDRFRFNPFFLANLKITDLTDFCVDCVFYDESFGIKLSIPQTKIQSQFEKDYFTELRLSYKLINTLLSQFDVICSYNEWICFCIKYSMLTEFVGR